MSAVKVQMSVMVMPAVPTHWEDTTVPATLDMREMDSTALVHSYNYNVYRMRDICTVIIENCEFSVNLQKFECNNKLRTYSLMSCRN